MKLALRNIQRGRFEEIRPLRSDEIEQHKEFTKGVSEARNRLSLFRMLEANYRQLRDYLDTLLCKTAEEDANSGEEIERLILNYLTFAYSIQEHFKVSLRRRFKKDTAKLDQYEAFLTKLCGACKPFAFVLDFRGYVQHVGLAVGHFNRQVTDTSVTIKITTDPARLCRESKDWKRSGLKSTDPTIDLVSTLREFHIQMLQSYGSYVATTFYPELVPASEFYDALTKEAKERDPDSTMVFIVEEPIVVREAGGKISANIKLLLPPNSLFHELGILRPKNVPKA
ncbi:hypothetical protein OVA24_05910 [Luteolibacter sp. SL250]|uniref:hypothetical protein n=1 Tax=Luteolibacter sp. SL250 TaxID=2995170 RepID=UPI00226F7408|nr:hypothetical protein [Luteolibacter sp. SL250]WAC20915.1 hypothetical protein OVA24_05910 [Luteolibacter sp. SL250]